MGVFLRRSRAANSVVGGPIWPKFKLIHNITHVLVTSKFEKDRININGDYVILFQPFLLLTLVFCTPLTLLQVKTVMIGTCVTLLLFFLEIH